MIDMYDLLVRLNLDKELKEELIKAILGPLPTEIDIAE